MYNNSSNGTRTAPARGIAALWAMLAMGLASMASPAEAAPFAYVTNAGSFGVTGTVSVIDTATNTVVATVTVGTGPFGVAVTPDGKHAYVTNGGGTVSVIDTASNTVVGTPIPVGSFPDGVAVTPDGKHAYVTNELSNNVSVIDTASNTVVATVAVGSFPFGVAITPDGKHAYVTNAPGKVTGTVSVIDTVATVVVGSNQMAEVAISRHLFADVVRSM
jgi:YVTN family beta-propeller protein